jgi:hypothetical protein
VAPLFDLLIENPDGIRVLPLLSESRWQSLQSRWEMYPVQWAAVVFKQSNSGGEVD